MTEDEKYLLRLLSESERRAHILMRALTAIALGEVSGDARVKSYALRAALMTHKAEPSIIDTSERKHE